MSGTPLEMNEVVGTQDYRSMVGRSSDGYANGALSIKITLLFFWEQKK